MGGCGLIPAIIVAFYLSPSLLGKALPVASVVERG